MARRRLQQKGDLYEQGGWWRLRWKEDKSDGSRGWSSPVVVGPAPGNPNLKPLTKREARRYAWVSVLSRLDQNVWTPKSVATVAEFVEHKFRPDHVDLKRKNTRIHYDHLLRNHVLPALGNMKLRDVRRGHVQRLASQVIAKGLSVQTAHHVVKTVSAIFTMAEDLEWSQGNPARRIKLPEMIRSYRADLAWPQVHQIAEMLNEPYGSMVVVLSQTGVRIGELCGLLWKWVNLTDAPVRIDGQTIEPYSILVRENFTAGESQSSPKGKKARMVPMTATVWVELASRREKAGDVAADSLVFPNRKGKPLDAHNIENRHFKPAAVKIGLPWACLHCLRHTTATMADEAKLTMKERMDMLGHNDIKTTMGYTHADLQRVREKLDAAENFFRSSSTSPKADIVQ